MTKTKLHETVLELCATFNASKKLTQALSELTKPKVGGSSDVNDYTIFATDGETPLFIFCTYHKTWEPFTATFEVEDEDTGEIGEETINLFGVNEKSKNGYHRQCLVADVQGREMSKIFNASKSAIMTDVLDEKISGADAKEAIDALEVSKAARPVRGDGLGSVDRPAVASSEA